VDLWQLHIFCQVVEKAGFSKAAESVHLTQPTISAHIKDLEEHFGCLLLDRLGRTVSPTPAGEVLYARAKKLLAQADEMESAVQMFLGRPRGKLALGASTIPGNYVLPAVLGPFVKQYPEISVSLAVADTKAIALSVAEGALEAGVVGALTKDRRLSHEKLLEDELLLVVPPDHPFAGKKQVEAADLPGQPFVLREEGSGTRRTLSDMLKAAGMDLSGLSVVAELGSTEAVRGAVCSGMGISLLSARAVGHELAAGLLKSARIKGLPQKRFFYLVTHRTRTPSPLCEAFVRHLKASFTRPY